ncbi:MAG: TRIC cation channel family protein [Puniceicoccales bacterium]|nr:TRIC cation channel family protein [Puniceicoccales bacterium]
MATSDFVLPAAIDFSATFFVGLSGALVGVRRGYDIVGIFFLAFLAAVGGALLRDGIFIQDGVPAILRHPLYLILIGAATVVGALFRNNLHRFGRLVSIMDAVGLAAYAVWGATKAMVTPDISPPGAILIGVINAIGGGCSGTSARRRSP